MLTDDLFKRPRHRTHVRTHVEANIKTVSTDLKGHFCMDLGPVNKSSFQFFSCSRILQ